MKYIVISDTHGNLARTKHVLGFAHHTKANGIIHCGDWDNVEAAEVIRDANLPLYAILGNADEPQAKEIWKVLKTVKGEVAVDVLETQLGIRKVAITHQPYKIITQIESQTFDAIFYGHTHKVKNEYQGKTLILNPGALHRAAKPTFAIYDTDTNIGVILEVPF